MNNQMNQPLTPEQLEGIKAETQDYLKFGGSARVMKALRMADKIPLLLAHIEAMAEAIEQLKGVYAFEQGRNDSLRSQLSTAKEAIMKDELESKITHPQIHADYYKWRSTLSIVDKMFFETCDKDGLVMWAWSRSRETMKEKNQLGPSKEFQDVMNNGTTEEIKAYLNKPQQSISEREKV